MLEGAKLSSMTSIPELDARLLGATADLVSLRPLVEAGEPWTLSDDFGTAPESSWGPREALAHIEEMLSFWLGEIERILEGSAAAAAGADGARPVPFGRIAADTVRLANIERGRTLPLRELYARIEDSSERVHGRLAELGPEEAQRQGLHPRQGAMTIEQIVDRYIVGHLEEHVAQLRDILAVRAG
jgi:hypothetical protein